MNGGIVPSILLCATLGLLLSFTIGRVAWFAVVAMTAAAAVFAMLTMPESRTAAIFVSIWATIIAAAAVTYFPPAVAQRLALPVAVAAGMGVGSLASLSGRKSDLMLALPISLLFVPGRWVIARGYGLGPKVVASWMIAIAMLSTFVSLTPTPGYQPDHME